jgi:hypothetical protein
MRTEELAQLLTSVEATAEVVDAIENPVLQRKQGWDLTNWTYQMIPWGVVLLNTDAPEREKVAVSVILVPEALPPELLRDCEGGRKRMVFLLPEQAARKPGRQERAPGQL